MTPTAVKTFERETVYWSENDSTKLREIPITFHDVEEYYATFYTTLVEEARSDLKDAYDGSIAGRRAFRISVERKWTESGCTYLELKLWNEGAPSIVEGTVIYISSARITNTRRQSELALLGTVATQTFEMGKRCEVRVIHPRDAKRGAEQLLEAMRPGHSKYLWAVPTCRLSTHVRQFEALAAVCDTNPVRQNIPLGSWTNDVQNFQHYLLNPECVAELSTAPPTVRQLNLDKAGGFVAPMQATLNNPQLDALLACVQRIHNSKKSDDSSPFSLIQGPPGTGKTKVILSLANVVHLLQFHDYFEKIMSLVKAGKVAQADSLKRKRQTEQDNANTHNFKPRILICAPSNAAVDNVLERIIRERFLQLDNSRYSPDILRLVSGDANVSTTAQSVSVEQRVRNLMEMSTLDWSSWYSRQYHTVTMSELKIKEHLGDDIQVLNSSERSIIQLYEVRDRALGDLARLERLRPLHHCTSTTQNMCSFRQISEHISASFVDEAEIVCCTLTSISKRHMLATSRPFKTIIIDEACQANELATLIPMTLSNAHCVLVGDPKQLPATVKSLNAKQAKFDRSLFERLMVAGMRSNLLTVQYRMHPQIRLFPSSIFYSNALIDAPGLAKIRDLSSHRCWPFQPYMVFDAVDGQEIQAANFSRYNHVEASFIVDLLGKYFQRFPLVDDSTQKVVVLSGYREQCELIQNMLRQKPTLSQLISVSTIDAFQGQEGDLIILSCVRTSANDIGFVSDMRRLNVALTRAKSSLWIVCKCDAVSKFNFWKALLKNAKERGCYTDNLQDAVSLE